jgi:hypothetical protein
MNPVKKLQVRLLTADRMEPQEGMGSAAWATEMYATILEPRGVRSRLKQPRLCLWLDLWRRTEASSTLGNLRKEVKEPNLVEPSSSIKKCKIKEPEPSSSIKKWKIKEVSRKSKGPSTRKQRQPRHSRKPPLPMTTYRNPV